MLPEVVMTPAEKLPSMDPTLPCVSSHRDLTPTCNVPFLQLCYTVCVLWCVVCVLCARDCSMCVRSCVSAHALG